MQFSFFHRLPSSIAPFNEDIRDEVISMCWYPMALKITDQCVNCDVCEPVCPNRAISLGVEFYEIAPDHCTECVGHFDTPQCIDVCPVECIVLDPTYAESRQQLVEKYILLTKKETA